MTESSSNQCELLVVLLNDGMFNKCVDRLAQ